MKNTYYNLLISFIGAFLIGFIMFFMSCSDNTGEDVDPIDDDPISIEDEYRITSLTSSRDGLYNYRYDFIYDDIRLTNITYKEHEAGIWEDVEHYEFIYDGDMVTCTKQEMDLTTQKWEEDYRMVMSFESKKLVSEHNYRIVDGNWELSSIYQYEFENGKLVELTASNGNIPTDISAKWKIIYDGDKILGIERFEYENGIEIEKGISEFSYQDQLLSLISWFDLEDGVKLLRAKYVYKYNGNLLQCLESYHNWGETGSDPLPLQYKSCFEYGDNNLIVKENGQDYEKGIVDGNSVNELLYEKGEGNAEYVTASIVLDGSKEWREISGYPTYSRIADTPKSDICFLLKKLQLM